MPTTTNLLLQSEIEHLRDRQASERALGNELGPDEKALLEARCRYRALAITALEEAQNWLSRVGD